jgi:hypothetical protein
MRNGLIVSLAPYPGKEIARWTDNYLGGGSMAVLGNGELDVVVTVLGSNVNVSIVVGAQGPVRYSGKRPPDVKYNVTQETTFTALEVIGAEMDPQGSSLSGAETTVGVRATNFSENDIVTIGATVVGGEIVETNGIRWAQ